MNLLGDHLRTLKAEIRFAIAEAVSKFEHNTGGLTPAAITIEMGETTTYGDQLRRFVVAEVRVRLPDV
jgi:hypothetical protein